MVPLSGLSGIGASSGANEIICALDRLNAVVPVLALTEPGYQV